MMLNKFHLSLNFSEISNEFELFDMSPVPMAAAMAAGLS